MANKIKLFSKFCYWRSKTSRSKRIHYQSSVHRVLTDSLRFEQLEFEFLTKGYVSFFLILGGGLKRHLVKLDKPETFFRDYLDRT